MPESMTILCAAKLAANQLERHLEPLSRLETVERILVVRHAPAAARLAKVENLPFGDAGTARNLGRMFASVDRVLRRERVDWVLGFNPVPWGAVAGAAALRRGVPLSLSFIGMDFKQVMRPWAWPIWQAVRRARLVTVTGERMRRGLVERGISAERIRVLPHAVDTERFRPASEEPDFDIVSVGQLIERKRMDVLIDAVGHLRDRGVRTRVGIAGDGPLRVELEQRIRARKLDDRIELCGYLDDVETFLRRGRVFVLASAWEGVPFAMIEAMCSGLVPVVTDVGTIADWVRDGDNGHIVPVGDALALSRSLERLLGDAAHYRALREAVLGMRSALSMETGVAFWREALAS
jgi:glycosyltransferase involved in cell wall biosynthesis